MKTVNDDLANPSHSASAVELLHGKTVIFWDFDGVVKDSLDVKTQAFYELYLPYGREVAERVRQHHLANGGVSRFHKIPLYLQWAGKAATAVQVTEFCERFSRRVLQAVVDAPWVPGVREYLTSRCGDQYFVLVTATPQEEITEILRALRIDHCFRECYGAPAAKSAAIAAVLRRLQLPTGEAVMVGDAEADHQAACENGVTFLLRRTSHNLRLQAVHAGPIFDHLELP